MAHAAARGAMELHALQVNSTLPSPLSSPYMATIWHLSSPSWSPYLAPYLAPYLDLHPAPYLAP